MGYISGFKDFPKKVPSVVVGYSNHIYNIINRKFDQWFNRKGLANYRDEVVITYKDAGISTSDFKSTPIESIRIIIRFKVTNNPSHNFGGLIHEISDRVSDVGTRSFKKKSFDGIVDYSYHIELEADFQFSRKIGTYDVEEFKKTLHNYCIHELSHAYESVHNDKDGTGLTSPGGIIMDLFDDTVRYTSKENSHGSILIYNFFHLIYLTAGEEMYANILASSAFDSVEEFKSSKQYQSIVPELRKFRATKFLRDLRREMGDEKIDGYSIPDDLPEMYANFYLESQEMIDKMNRGRNIDHDKYLDLAELEVVDFLSFWEEEFHEAADFIEEKSIDIINNKLT